MKLNEYMAEYHFSERHCQRIAASPATVYPLLKMLDLRRSRIICFLFMLRNGYRRLGRKGEERGLYPTLPVLMDKTGFFLLDETPHQEIVIGKIGQPWKPDYDSVVVPSTEFSSYKGSGLSKIAWNFCLEEDEAGNTFLTTETRIWTDGRVQRMLFALYWIIVRPFSGLIRILMLREIQRQAIEESDSCLK